MKIYDFYADWCGPCQMMKPIMEEFEKSHPDVEVRRINIDEEPDLAEQYHISSIPCLVAIKDGEEVNRIFGAVSIKKIEKLIGG